LGLAGKIGKPDFVNIHKLTAHIEAIDASCTGPEDRLQLLVHLSTNREVKLSRAAAEEVNYLIAQARQALAA